ncbi:DUF3520 domain-containing protein [candidate division GN15 bacterium]|nr:DUF3520 domain-containing protein [candidate division GN15 bacterium]
MLRCRIFILLGLAVLLAGSAAAATGAVSGRIVDRATGQPVADAVVTVFPPGDSTRTDADGQFSFDRVAPGDYMLEISHPDYETFLLSNHPVTVAKNATITIELTRRSRHSPRSSAEATAQDEAERLVKTLNELRQAEPRREQATAGQSVGLPAPTGQVQPNTIRRKAKPVAPRPMPPYPPQRPDYDDYYGLPPFDMFFRDYGTNRFVDARRDNLSTFAADVDDAAYTLVRRYLHDGHLPPRDAIRVEEFINHFDYGYRPPTHSKFRIVTDAVRSPFDDSTITVAVGLKGREIDRRERKPLNLTFVIDVSGSMGYDNRLELVKYALRELVNQLGREDKIGIVVYGSGAHVVLEPSSMHRRHDILYQIERLRPGGSTNAEAGLRLGYEMALRQFVPGHGNRIILCSDGVANVGLTQPEALMETIQERAGKGITLHSFGVGMGNYNDVLLEKLAQQGDGRYAYINNRREAHKVMVEDFVANMELLGRDVKIQVEFDPRVVRSYRLLGYENRDVEDHRFRDNRRDGGEIGAGHEVTALYEVVLNRRAKNATLGTIAVRWTDEDGYEVAEINQKLRIRLHSYRHSCEPDLRLALTAAKFAEMLKDTPYVRDLTIAELRRFAEPLLEQMPSEQTHDLLDLIDAAGRLGTYHSRR